MTSSIQFEYAASTVPTAGQTSRSTVHGLQHLVEIEHPLTPQKLLAAELQFLIWFQGNSPGRELLDWVAKDPGSGRIFARYHSDLRKILDMTETQRALVRRVGEGGARFTIVEN